MYSVSVYRATAGRLSARSVVYVRERERERRLLLYLRVGWQRVHPHICDRRARAATGE